MHALVKLGQLQQKIKNWNHRPTPPVTCNMGSRIKHKCWKVSTWKRARGYICAWCGYKSIWYFCLSPFNKLYMNHWKLKLITKIFPQINTDSECIDRQVAVLTSARLVFILINPSIFFTLQLAFTTSAISSGAFPGALLFLVRSLSISLRNPSTPGSNLFSTKDILVSSGANIVELRQQPSTLSFLPSGWIKLRPSRSLSRISGQPSHSSHMPSTSNTSFSTRLVGLPFRLAMNGERWRKH